MVQTMKNKWSVHRRSTAITYGTIYIFVNVYILHIYPKQRGNHRSVYHIFIHSHFLQLVKPIAIIIIIITPSQKGNEIGCIIIERERKNKNIFRNINVVFMLKLVEKCGLAFVRQFVIEGIAKNNSFFFRPM